LAAAHLQLGIIHQAAGNWKGALERYRRTADLDPENASVRYRLATAYGKVGEREKSRAEMAEFRRLKAQQSVLKERP
jgi:Flp pilus assembly protein TadD